MRALITGASGFAGQHLARACAEAGDEVLSVSRSGPLAVDLRDGEAVARLIREVRPEVVYHLAALSSVGRSWEKPAQTVNDNVSVAVGLLESLRAEAPDTRVVWASSCEVYGAPSQLPVGEAAPLAPANPYAVSKATGDMLARVYASAHDLDLARVRPFNHAGPGQAPIFIVSSIARQAAAARVAGAAEVQIVTGNPETRRDFVDVRDVVEAYRLIALEGSKGEVYNVCSGRSVSAAEHVQLLADLVAPMKVNHVVDPSLVRGHEVMELRGDGSRMAEAFGWEPTIPLRRTIADTLEWWQGELTD